MREISEETLEEWETREREKAQKPKRPQKKSGRSVFRLKKIIEEKGGKDGKKYPQPR